MKGPQALHDLCSEHFGKLKDFVVGVVAVDVEADQHDGLACFDKNARGLLNEIRIGLGADRYREQLARINLRLAFGLGDVGWNGQKGRAARRCRGNPHGVAQQFGPAAGKRHFETPAREFPSHTDEIVDLLEIVASCALVDFENDDTTSGSPSRLALNMLSIWFAVPTVPRTLTKVGSLLASA